MVVVTSKELDNVALHGYAASLFVIVPVKFHA